MGIRTMSGYIFDASTELVVNTADQAVAASRFRLDGQTVLRAGSREQATLASAATTCESTGLPVSGRGPRGGRE